MDSWQYGYNSVEEADELLKEAYGLQTKAKADELVTRIKSAIKELVTISYPGRPNPAIYKTLSSALKVASEAAIDASRKPFSINNDAKATIPIGNDAKCSHSESISALQQGATPCESEPLLVVDSDNIKIRRQHNLCIVKTAEELEHVGSVSIEDVDGCRILFLGIVQSVYIKNVTNSVIWFGVVKFSAIMNTVTDSCLVLSCRQLRIGKSQRTRFYVTSKTDPIIELSSDLLFTYNHLSYPMYSEQLESCDIQQNAEGEVIKVVDFSWHKPGGSTNWSSVPNTSAPLCVNVVIVDNPQISKDGDYCHKTLSEHDWESISKL